MMNTCLTGPFGPVGKEIFIGNLQPYRSVIGLGKWIRAGSWDLTFWDEDVTEGRGMVQKN